MIDECIAKSVGPDRIDIAYERRGDPSHPPVILIMGLAAQMIHWPRGFVEALLEKDLQVVRFDNRDAGRSSHMHSAPVPDFGGAMKGDFSTVSYTLSDMAADTVGLMDALEIPKAHIVGASMGGAIAQMIAIEHPERVRSLVSMMSTTGNPTVGQIQAETQRALFDGPPAKTRNEVMARALRHYKMIGSPLYPVPEEDIAATAGLAWDRDHDELSIIRQAVATLATGDRTEKLKNLQTPTLVIHGEADTMCDPSGGRATAAAIPGAEHELIEGMGHNLPPQLWPSLVERIFGFLKDH